MIETIESDANRLTRLITELLDISRLDSDSLNLRLGPVDLHDLLRTHVVRHELGRANGAVRLELGASATEHGLPEMWADADRLEQIFFNLIENALRHGAGIVTVTLDRRGDVGRRARRRRGRRHPAVRPREDLRPLLARPVQREHRARALRRAWSRRGARRHGHGGGERGRWRSLRRASAVRPARRRLGVTRNHHDPPRRGRGGRRARRPAEAAPTGSRPRPRLGRARPGAPAPTDESSERTPMSGPNTNYDPVEVAALDPAQIDAAVEQALAAVAAAGSLEELKAVRPAHRASAAPLALANREIGALPPSAKAEAGKRVGQARGRVAQAFAARQAELEAERDERMLVEERVDVTLPGAASPARRPPPDRAHRPSGSSTSSSAWAGRSPRAPRSRASGSTSTPSTSAPTTRRGRCRTPSSSTRVDSGVVLRTHTSPVQIRTMLEQEPPIYVVCPGQGVPHRRAGRDAHPGLPPDRVPRRRQGPDDGPPKGTLDHFVAVDVRRGDQTRLRANYFPFTEPSAEMDILCFVCHGAESVGTPEPCRTCGGEGWIELGGCGMVNRTVLRACGIDPDMYSGFAFGIGIERTLMFRHGVAGHATTWSRATCASRGRSGWRSDAGPAVLAARVRRPARRRDRPRRRRPSSSPPASRWRTSQPAPTSPGRSSSAGCSTSTSSRRRTARPSAGAPVDVGEHGQTLPGQPQEIVCGARNFEVGDMVVVVLPGAVLPGGFAIAARKTYGHVSNGMICSERRARHGRRRTTASSCCDAGAERDGRRRRDRAARPRRRGARHRRHPRPRLLPVDARRRPRGRHGVRRAAARPGAARRPRANDRRLPGAASRRAPAAAVFTAAHASTGIDPKRAVAALAAAAAAADGHAADLARRRRHQLRDARARPAAARATTAPGSTARSWSAGPSRARS